MVRGDEFYMRAFWELSSCRQFGDVIGPIPWDKIMDYAERKHLEPDMIAVFEDVMRQLDEAYLGWQRDALKAKTKK